MRGRNKDNKCEQRLEPQTEDICNTLTSVQKDNLVLETEEIPKIKVRQATTQGFIEVEGGGVVDLSYPTSQKRRGRVQGGGQICPTLTTESIPSVVEYGDDKHFSFIYEIGGAYYRIRIRKLTPRECWRLMGFTDSDFDKAEQINSNTQLYKQAGNSIVKNVLMAIFSQMV